MYLFFTSIEIENIKLLSTLFSARVNGEQLFDERKRPVSNELRSMCHLPVDLFSISRQLQLEETSACAGLFSRNAPLGATRECNVWLCVGQPTLILWASFWTSG